MKVTPRKYALALLAALEDVQDERIIIHGFLAFLWRKKQFRLLPKVLKSFEEAWNEKNGILKLTVWHPGKFEKIVEELRDSLKKHFTKEPIMTALPDDTLLGGYRIRFADYLIDASVSGQLHRLKHKMIST